ncbi:MAG TPA: ABC-F family ATP-binding cassette domain-containing protein [bacterium]|nr:ABC-F family ATP-binding cassette domain-containing protein [bacterium]HPS30230.1 ABC-F family ATP-binding cassette domain-containing protein [bacterium]
MQLVKITDLYFKYQESVDFILENINCEINYGDRIGIVGSNGGGKSTLMKLICGAVSPSEGSIFARNEDSIAYLPQDYSGLDREIGESGAEYLSGGEKVKLLLRKIISGNPDLILLDEPTNHLDIKGIEWLEKFIRRIPAAVVIISHDRSILNNCVDEIWEIDAGSLTIYRGNYDTYEKFKADESSRRQKAYSEKKDQVKRLETAVTDRKSRAEKNEKFKPSRSVKKNGSLCQYDVGSIKSVRSGNLMNSAKALESRIEKEKEEMYKLKEGIVKKAKVQINPGGSKSRFLVKMFNVSKSFNEKNVLNAFSLSVERGEKIALTGPNGCGKSTLLKIITGELTPDAGEVSISPSIKTGYFAQGSAELPDDEKIINFLAHGDRALENRARLFLGCLNIRGDTVFRKIGTLSAGQKSKVEIASFMLGEYDLIILDEPMSHLEINARTALEEALRNFEGAAIVVTHDRTFAQNFADRIVTL